MKIHFAGLSLAALFFGSAWATVHGCSAGSNLGAPVAHADDADGATSACAPATCTPPPPRLLTSYDQLLTTLKGGSRVRVVIDYAKCQLDGKPGPNALGAMGFDTFEFFGAGLIGNAQAFVAASENHLIKFDTGYVYDYVRISVNADSTVKVEVQYLKPSTFEVTVDETFACTLNDGSNGHAVTLFATGG